jgi:hypothetical protein
VIGPFLGKGKRKRLGGKYIEKREEMIDIDIDIKREARKYLDWKFGRSLVT